MGKVYGFALLGLSCHPFSAGTNGSLLRISKKVMLSFKVFGAQDTFGYGFHSDIGKCVEYKIRAGVCMGAILGLER
jgi:hypothetical protein